MKNITTLIFLFLAGLLVAQNVPIQNAPYPLFMYSVKTDEIFAQWQDLGGSVTFAYEHANNAAFSSGVVSGTTSSNSFTISGLSTNTKKYFRVKAVRSGYSDSDWVVDSMTTMFSNIVGFYTAVGIEYDKDNSYAATTGTVIDTLKGIVNTSAPKWKKTFGAFAIDNTVIIESSATQSAMSLGGGGYLDALSNISLGSGAFTIMFEVHMGSSSPGGAAQLFSDAVVGGNRLVRYSGLTDCSVGINNTLSSQMFFPKPWKNNVYTVHVIECDGTNVRASCDGGNTWSNWVTRPSGAFNLNRIGASAAGGNSMNGSFKFIFFADKQLSKTERDRVIYFNRCNPKYNAGSNLNITPTGLPSTFNSDPINHYVSFVTGVPSRGQGYGLSKNVFSIGDYNIISVSKKITAPEYSDSYVMIYNSATNKVYTPIPLGHYATTGDIHERPSLDLGDNTIGVSQMSRHYSIPNGGTFLHYRRFGKNFDFSDFQSTPVANNQISYDTIASSYLSKSQYHQKVWVGNAIFDVAQRWNGSGSFAQYINLYKSVDGGNSYETIKVVDTGASLWVYPSLIYTGERPECVLVVEEVNPSSSPVQCEGLTVIRSSDGYWWQNMEGTYKKNVKESGAFTVSELYANATIIDARSLTSTLWSHGYMTNSGMFYGVYGDGNNTGWKLWYQTPGGAATTRDITFDGKTVVTGTQTSTTGSSGIAAYHRSPIVALYRGGTTWWVVALEVNGGNWKPLLFESTDDGVTWSYLREVGIPEAKQHIELEFSQNYHQNGDKGVLVFTVLDSSTLSRQVVIDVDDL